MEEVDEEDTEVKVMAELTVMPVSWFLEERDRVEKVLAWVGDYLALHYDDDDMSKWLEVLLAADYATCEWCGSWIHASSLVLVGTTRDDLDYICCKGKCESAVHRRYR